MINKRTKGLNINLMVVMVVILCVAGLNMETNRESQEGTVSYVTQLERLAGSKGYTTGDKVTYNERLHLETEEGRYKEVMNYLGGVEVSDSEFKEIKEIQSKYEQSVQQVNESGKKDYSLLFSIVFGILTIIVIGLLITTSIGAY